MANHIINPQFAVSREGWEMPVQGAQNKRDQIVNHWPEKPTVTFLESMAGFGIIQRGDAKRAAHYMECEMGYVAIPKRPVCTCQALALGWQAKDQAAKNEAYHAEQEVKRLAATPVSAELKVNMEDGSQMLYEFHNLDEREGMSLDLEYDVPEQVFGRNAPVILLHRFADVKIKMRVKPDRKRTDGAMFTMTQFTKEQMDARRRAASERARLERLYPAITRPSERVGIPVWLDGNLIGVGRVRASDGNIEVIAGSSGFGRLRTPLVNKGDKIELRYNGEKVIGRVISTDGESVSMLLESDSERERRRQVMDVVAMINACHKSTAPGFRCCEGDDNNHNRLSNAAADLIATLH